MPKRGSHAAARLSSTTFGPQEEKPMDKNRSEKTTVKLMIEVYCRGQHATKSSLCDDCRDLLEYAEKKLDKCPFTNKSNCNDCKVHCYAPDKRSAIREIMRYSGKRMILKHPVMTIVHYMRKREWRRKR